jgi:uncharacterized membrane protein YdbT with pleckstrin-like domain
MIAIDLSVNSALRLLSVFALCPLLGAPFFLLAEWIECVTTEIAVTDQRVIFKRGWICRATTEMNAGQIESVRLRQSVLGRLLDFGTIRIEGTGSTIELLRAVARPLEIRKAVGAISKVRTDGTPVRNRAAQTVSPAPLPPFDPDQGFVVHVV